MENRSWMNILLFLLIFFLTFSAYALSGQAVYTQSCIACHGASGRGAVPGAPDFTSKNGPLNKSDKILLEHIINGYQSPGSPMAMPPKGGNPKLTDDDLKNSLNYIRRKFEQKTSMQNKPSIKVASNTGIVSLKETKNLKNNKTSTEAILPVSPEETASIARGAQAWAVTCSGCHNARSPNEFSSEQWHTIMQHMRVQAHLTGKQTRDMLKFLQNSSQ